MVECYMAYQMSLTEVTFTSNNAFTSVESFNVKAFNIAAVAGNIQKVLKYLWRKYQLKGRKNHYEIGE